MMQNQVLFKKTFCKDIQVGDVQMSISEEKKTYFYYYLQAETVFVGDKQEAIYDPFTNVFVGNRTTNCVEIRWKPLNYDGNPITLQYSQEATLDIATDVVDVNNLVQEEDATE